MDYYLSALVTLIVTAGVIVSMIQASKRHHAASIRRTHENFIVRGGRSAVVSVSLALFVPVFFSLLFSFMQLQGGLEEMKAGAWYFMLMAVFLIASALLAVDYMNHKLTIKGERLIYSDWRGRESTFSISDIDSVLTGKGRLLLFNAEGYRLAVVDKNMIGAYDLFEYLKIRGLAELQTLDK